MTSILYIIISLHFFPLLLFYSRNVIQPTITAAYHINIHIFFIRTSIYIHEEAF